MAGSYSSHRLPEELNQLAAPLAESEGSHFSTFPPAFVVGCFVELSYSEV